jgi:hypothetical protein
MNDGLIFTKEHVGSNISLDRKDIYMVLYIMSSQRYFFPQKSDLNLSLGIKK